LGPQELREPSGRPTTNPIRSESQGIGVLTPEEEIAQLRARIEELEQEKEIRDLRAREQALEEELSLDDSYVPSSYIATPGSVSTERSRTRREAERFINRLEEEPTQTLSENLPTTENDTDNLFPHLTDQQLRDEQSFEKNTKYTTPKEYNGKNLEEHRTFFSVWETAFRLVPYTFYKQSKRVLAATGLLRGEPLKLWEKEMSRFKTHQLRWELIHMAGGSLRLVLCVAFG
jgi:hypothetical protein